MTQLAVVVARLVALALVVAAVFALVVLGIGDVPTEDQWTLIGFAALAAAVTALVFARVDRRVSDRARTLMTRGATPPRDVVQAFSGRAASGLPVDELVASLVELLRAALTPTRVEVWTYHTTVLELAAGEPRRDHAPVLVRPVDEAAAVRAGVVGRTWLELWFPDVLGDGGAGNVRAAPLTHAGELVGMLIVERAAPDFTEQEDADLALLARQAALALRNVRLGSALDDSLEELRLHAEALRESRARIVAVADAERSRIERDLHDGAQQHLLGLVVNLKVARELAASDPERADAILAELSGEAHAALEELRDLAHGIFPPLLTDRGLGDAVRAAVARLPLAGAVATDGIARYPPQVEATAYFCCVEALQNAAKHSGAGTRVDVRLWEQDGALQFEVRDTGAGFDPPHTAEGAGFTNMRDRIGALGGRLRVESAPGQGTNVLGAVPFLSRPALADRAARP